jgi:hypothetical protein
MPLRLRQGGLKQRGDAKRAAATAGAPSLLAWLLTFLGLAHEPTFLAFRCERLTPAHPQTYGRIGFWLLLSIQRSSHALEKEDILRFESLHPAVPWAVFSSR